MRKLLSILLVLFIAVGALTSCDALGGQTPGDKLYRAFTKAEEMMIEDTVGEKIPFLPNDEYYIEIPMREYFSIPSAIQWRSSRIYLRCHIAPRWSGEPNI